MRLMSMSRGLRASAVVLFCGLLPVATPGQIARAGSLGAPVTISTEASSNVGATYTAAVALPGGGFVAAWSDRQAGDDGNNLYMRRLDGEAQPLGAVQRINLTPGREGFWAGSVTLLADGGNRVRALWIEAGWYEPTVLYTRLYDAALNPLGEPQVLTPLAQDLRLYDYSVAGDERGNFVLALTSTGQSNIEALLQVRRYDASAQPLDAAAVPVGAVGTDPYSSPSLVMDRNTGNFAVAWAWNGGIPPAIRQHYSIQLQRFLANGRRLGPPRLVDYSSQHFWPPFPVAGLPVEPLKAQAWPALLAGPAGSYAVVWKEQIFDQLNSVQMRRYAPGTIPQAELAVAAPYSDINGLYWPLLAAGNRSGLGVLAMPRSNGAVQGKYLLPLVGPGGTPFDVGEGLLVCYGVAVAMDEQGHALFVVGAQRRDQPTAPGAVYAQLFTPD